MILILCLVLRRFDLKKWRIFWTGCHTFDFRASVSFFVSNLVPSNFISLYEGSRGDIFGGMSQSSGDQRILVPGSLSCG